MAKILKRIDAGCLHVEVIYDRCRASDTPRQRQAKHKASSEAQRRMNQIYSWQQLELRLAANFPTAGSALVVTLTFDDAHMPKDRKEAQQRMKYFRKKFTAARIAAGLPAPVIFWTPEILSSASQRWHFHMVVDNTGQDLEIIRRCWIYGSDVEAEKLRVDREKNHETLARYVTKELRECQEYDAKPGLHGWSCTRNAKRPEIETVTVPDDFRLEPPRGCTVLIDERQTNEWASWRVLKYRTEKKDRPPRARRKKR